MPSSPSSPSSRAISFGKTPSSNQPSMPGSTRLRTKSRTVSRISLSSSLRREPTSRKSEGSSRLLLVAGGWAVVLTSPLKRAGACSFSREPYRVTGVGDIAVLGGGHGALATAADLALRGFRVRLALRNRRRFSELFETGRLTLAGAGAEGEAQLAQVTDDHAAAVRGVELALM